MSEEMSEESDRINEVRLLKSLKQEQKECC
jgi:hypothetical protein